MAERRRDSSLEASPPGRISARRPTKPVKERWLLTRKTWRYMADAGRRLIPADLHEPCAASSVPRLERYFQEVCSREPRFLLWRKASYPGCGGLARRRPRHRPAGGSCRAGKTRSADDRSPSSPATTSARPDLAKLKRDWLLSTSVGGGGGGDSDQALADMLRRYLDVRDSEATSSARSGAASRDQPVRESTAASTALDYRTLVDKLERHLGRIMSEQSSASASAPTATTSTHQRPYATTSHGHYQSDHVHKSLLETLSRYYSKSPNRQHVISDILTDRKLLEKLYFDLRCTRGFRGPRATGAYASPSARWWPSSSGQSGSGAGRSSSAAAAASGAPPLIAVQGPSTERLLETRGTQTDPLSRECIEQQLQRDAASAGKEQQHKQGRRRSSLDNDDVSPSVSDTIKRYLRMARKKSIDADKAADRFKRVNYDRNLRNIRAKGPGDDEGSSKGCQCDEGWALGYRELSSLEPGEALVQQQQQPLQHSDDSRNASSRSSVDAGLDYSPRHHQSFLSHLLHGSHHHGSHHGADRKPHSAPGSPALDSSSSSNNPPGGSAMQKSKSSSSVVHHGSRLVAKKIWKSRSKSSSRAINLVSAWTPQGKCTWAGTGGRRVTLQDTPLRSLSDVERKVLCRVAVAKLQALNLGVHIRPPSESLSGGSVSAKPKRRAYLLKRKALTTGFFDSKSKEDKDKDSSGGLVFGISLGQCLENDRLARIASGEIVDVGCLSRSSRHGSRTSFTSLNETIATTAAKTDEGGSCESLSSKGGALTGSDSGVLELSDGGPSGEYDAVPTIVRQCIRHLESCGLHTLGIFRVSPSKKRVRQLREDWDYGRENKIGADQCPHDVAALLKEYFRDLPDPLLCRDLYQAFVHTQKIRNRRLQQEALQHLIQLLPTPNRETLYALLNFLSEVAANSEDRKTADGETLPGNKMDATNLATVFAPNILHCVKPGQARSEVSAERAEERIDVINVVRALLEHASALFIVPAALLDELYLHMMDSHPAELDLALSRRSDEQCPDEAELCSEADNCSAEDNAPPASPARKLYSREECLHQMAGVGGDIGPRPRRPRRPGSRRLRASDESVARRGSLDSGSSEDPADPRRKSSPMVITASLTIPMTGALTLNLDDPDIPYIEEQAPGAARRESQAPPQQQQQPAAPSRRQRQRSASGSEAGGRHGSDSAVGSSSACTLSGDQPPSSPPSWASSPPASPDSASTAVSYIPEPQQAVLQRVSFTTSSELRQIARSTSQQEASRASLAPAHTPSITSIGGAVMRSKTADIERMLQMNRAEPSSARQQQQQLLDNKKYTKRRYTDSRHQTRHIPDADSLGGSSVAPSSLASRLSSALHQRHMSSTTPSTVASSATSSSTGTTQPVWKRRELISSAPKERGSFF